MDSIRDDELVELVMTRSRRTIAATVATAIVGSAAALGAFTAPTVKFSDTRLANGLRVIISENHAAPVFSLALLYNVGSRDEREGRTGFAHLFEHMMFKGSENVGTGEHFYTIFSNGGTMNGTTNKERTLYFETMPINQLEAALFLEADRMRSLAIVKENLDNQRNAVQEERRLRVDNQPYGRADEEIETLAFDNAAYRHSVSGSMADLNAASVEDVTAFFKTYYAPNNAILALAGDLNSAAALARVRTQFESIPMQPAPPPVDTAQSQQDRERRLVIDDPLARVPRIDIGYRIPPTTSPDNETFEVLSTILAGGRSSRFYEHIVRQQQRAVSIGAYVPNSRGPRLFGIEATAVPGTSLDALEQAIYSEIDGVKAGPIAEPEIEKARNEARRRFIGSMSSTLPLARGLAEFALFYGDANRINTRWDRLATFRAADVQRVAREYFTPENRTVVISIPKSPAAPASGAAQ
jgi:zinc protease